MTDNEAHTSSHARLFVIFLAKLNQLLAMAARVDYYMVPSNAGVNFTKFYVFLFIQRFFCIQSIF
jgi:hypothetical protein